MDEEATAELDLADVAGMTTVGGATVSDLGEVRAATQRGNAIVVAILRSDGRTVKDIVPANDQYVAPRETPVEAAARQSTLSNVELTQEVWKLREELAAELAELRAERGAEVGETLVEKQEEAAEAAAEASEEAAKAEAEAGEQAEAKAAPKSRAKAKKDE